MGAHPQEQRSEQHRPEDVDPDRRASRKHKDREALHDQRSHRLRQPISLAAYLQSCPSGELSNWPVYTIDDQVVVDVMLRHEHLEQDLAALAERLRLERPLQLPVQRPKGQIRKDRRPWQEVLDPEGERRIRQVCARELAAFYAGSTP